MKKLILTLTGIALIISLTILGCRKTSEQLQDEAYKRAEELNALPQAYTKVAVPPCSCASYINQNCQECVTKHLMEGKLEKTYSLVWNNCNNGCKNYSVQTAIKFCYDPSPANTSDCALIVNFYGLPPCLAGCYLTDSMCIKSTAHCTGNGNEVIVTGSFVGTDKQQHEYQFTFGADPKVKLCCANICCDGMTQP